MDQEGRPPGGEQREEGDTRRGPKAKRNRPRDVRTDSDRMWDRFDVADFLKVTTDWVHRHYHAGDLPGTKLPGSRRIRFNPAEIRAYAKGEWPPKAA